MDREGLEQELRGYFQVEVKKIEPSSEWWDRAISRLTEQKHRSRWFGFMPKTRLAWALLPLVLLLIGGAAYGASSLIKELFQKYAIDVEKAGLAQELDLSETIDGVTVKLERAYADANVVLVGFTVSGPKTRYYADFGELSTVEGQSLPVMLGMGFVPGSDIILGEWGDSERVAMIATFDASSVKGMPSELNLRLETSIADSPILGEKQDSVGPFIFEFSVPFHAGKVINSGQTVESGGVPITLEQVIITPWATRAVFQFQPNENRYLPVTSLKLPGGDVKNAWFSKDAGTSSEQFIVGDFTGQAGEWTIAVNELVIMPDASGQKEGTHPASDTQRLTGPWIFHVDVP